MIKSYWNQDLLVLSCLMKMKLCIITFTRNTHTEQLFIVT